MIRLCVVCEGATEAEFVKTSIEPHLRRFDIHTYPSLLKTKPGRTGGGNVSVGRLVKHFRNEYLNTDVVTSLVDYYGFKDKGNQDPSQLEKTIQTEVETNLRHYDRRRILPYVQVHEFEGLLFSDVTGFEWVIDGWSQQAFTQLDRIAKGFRTPEDINDSPITAPSKRLAGVFGRTYNKVEHGPIVAEAIGLDSIRSKCPRFNRWISRLEQVGDTITT